MGKGDYAAPAEDATARLTATILTAADRCIACRVEMDAFMAHYRARQCPEVGMIHPAFRALVADFAVPWEELVAAVDEAEHPNAYFHPASPLTRPLDWRALIADPRLLAALEHSLAREQEHVRALAVARFRGPAKPSSR